MKSRDDIAGRAIKYALAMPPDGVLFGDITALELVSVLYPNMDTCPMCGACAFVNLDCDLCNVMGNCIPPTGRINK